MAKSLMVMGTSPKSGKSFFISALCRIFADDGYKAAPFKAQSITSEVKYTEEGFEIDSQMALLADAARKKPDIRMNPVLLKPCGEGKFDVAVCGKLMGEMTQAQYAASFDDIIPEVINAYKSLSAENDIVVIEADGTPAEGLRYNIGGPDLAEMLAAPIIIISDYLKGGAFSAAYGSFAFADRDLKSFIKGFIINNLESPDREHERNVAKLSEMAGLSFVSAFKRVNVASLDGRKDLEAVNANDVPSGSGIVKANPFFSSGSEAKNADFRGDYGNAEDIFKSADSVQYTESDAGAYAFGFDEQAPESSEHPAAMPLAGPSALWTEISPAKMVQNEYVNSPEIEEKPENIFAGSGTEELEKEIVISEADKDDKIADPAKDSSSDGGPDVYIDDMLLGDIEKQVADINETLAENILDNSLNETENNKSPLSASNNFDDIDEFFLATKETIDNRVEDYGKEFEEKPIEKKYAEAGVEELEKEIDILKSNIENKIYTQNDSSADDIKKASIGNLLEDIEKRIAAINVSHAERVLGEPLSKNKSCEELKPLSFQDVNDELFPSDSVDKNPDISGEVSKNETVFHGLTSDEETSFSAENSADIAGKKRPIETFEEIHEDFLSNSDETPENFEAEKESSVDTHVDLEHSLISLEIEHPVSSLMDDADSFDALDIAKSEETAEKDETAEPLPSTEDELDKMFSFAGWKVSTNIQPTTDNAELETTAESVSIPQDTFHGNNSKTDNTSIAEVVPREAFSNQDKSRDYEFDKTPSSSKTFDAEANKKSETPSNNDEEINDITSLEKELKREIEFLSDKDGGFIENDYPLANQTKLIQKGRPSVEEGPVSDIKNYDTDSRGQSSDAVSVIPQNQAEARGKVTDIVRAEPDTVNSSVNVAIIDLPHATYKRGFDYLKDRGMSVSYVSDTRDFGTPDFIVIPDTLKPMSDMVWMRDNGMELFIKSNLLKKAILLGICGGFHTFSEIIQDPHGKDIGGEINAMSLFKMKTVLGKDRKVTKVRGIFKSFEGLLSPLNGKNFEGNAILSPRTVRATHKNISVIIDKESGLAFKDGICEKNVLGLNVFGILQNKVLFDIITDILMEFKKGKNIAAAYLSDTRARVRSFASNDEVRLSVNPEDAAKISKKLENKSENPIENANRPNASEPGAPMTYNDYDNVNGIISESYNAFGSIVSADTLNTADKSASTEAVKPKDIDSLAKYVKENLDIKKIYEIISKGV